MEIVIEIGNEHYERIMRLEEDVTVYPTTLALYEAVKNGTPLPKGHGRLIDADRLTRAEIIPLWYHLPNGDIACPKIDIDHAPTIIETDKEITNETNN